MKTDKILQPMIAITFLGLNPKEHLTDEKIDSAYKRMARTIHPDVCNGPEASRLMHLANESKILLKSVVEQQRNKAPLEDAVRTAKSTVIFRGNTIHWHFNDTGNI